MKAMRSALANSDSSLMDPADRGRNLRGAGNELAGHLSRYLAAAEGRALMPVEMDEAGTVDPPSVTGEEQQQGRAKIRWASMSVSDQSEPEVGSPRFGNRRELFQYDLGIGEKKKRPKGRGGSHSDRKEDLMGGESKGKEADSGSTTCQTGCRTKGDSCRFSHNVQAPTNDGQDQVKQMKAESADFHSVHEAPRSLVDHQRDGPACSAPKVQSSVTPLRRVLSLTDSFGSAILAPKIIPCVECSERNPVTEHIVPSGVLRAITDTLMENATTKARVEVEKKAKAHEADEELQSKSYHQEEMKEIAAEEPRAEEPAAEQPPGEEAPAVAEEPSAKEAPPAEAVAEEAPVEESKPQPDVEDLASGLGEPGDKPQPAEKDGTDTIGLEVSKPQLAFDGPDDKPQPEAVPRPRPSLETALLWSCHRRRTPSRSRDSAPRHSQRGRSRSCSRGCGSPRCSSDEKSVSLPRQPPTKRHGWSANRCKPQDRRDDLEQKREHADALYRDFERRQAQEPLRPIVVRNTFVDFDGERMPDQPGGSLPAVLNGNVDEKVQASLVAYDKELKDKAAKAYKDEMDAFFRSDVSSSPSGAIIQAGVSGLPVSAELRNSTETMGSGRAQASSEQQQQQQHTFGALETGRTFQPFWVGCAVATFPTALVEAPGMHTTAHDFLPSGMTEPPGALGLPFQQPQLHWQQAPTVLSENIRTTTMVFNLNHKCNRYAFQQYLDANGFQGLYDFLYVSMCWEGYLKGQNRGHAAVNWVDNATASRAGLLLSGKTGWPFNSEEDKCSLVKWSDTQGLDAQIKEQRNSPTMLRPDPVERPAIFNNGTRVKLWFPVCFAAQAAGWMPSICEGVELQFPSPTKQIQNKVRFRPKNLGRQSQRSHPS